LFLLAGSVMLLPLRFGEVRRLSPFSVGCKNDFPKSEKMTLLQGKKCYM
jgi:hypothetical protein